jgi:hypothetical protein
MTQLRGPFEKRSKVGKLLVLLTFLGDYPTVPQNYKDAADTSRRALMADKSIKEDIDKTTNRAERVLNNVTGLKPEDLTFLAYGTPLITKKVSTKPFKGLKLNLGHGFVVRPEIEYNFNPGAQETFTCFLILTREF